MSASIVAGMWSGSASLATTRSSVLALQGIQRVSAAAAAVRSRPSRCRRSRQHLGAADVCEHARQTERLGWYLAGMAASVPRCPPRVLPRRSGGKPLGVGDRRRSNRAIRRQPLSRVRRAHRRQHHEHERHGYPRADLVTEGGFRGGAGGNKIGVLDPRTGEVVELPLPTANAQPVALLRDADGTIWFGQSGPAASDAHSRDPSSGRPCDSEDCHASTNSGVRSACAERDADDWRGAD